MADLAAVSYTKKQGCFKHYHKEFKSLHHALYECLVAITLLSTPKCDRPKNDSQRLGSWTIQVPSISDYIRWGTIIMAAF
jgi:hypothetical protein